MINRLADVYEDIIQNDNKKILMMRYSLILFLVAYTVIMIFVMKFVVSKLPGDIYDKFMNACVIFLLQFLIGYFVFKFYYKYYNKKYKSNILSKIAEYNDFSYNPDKGLPVDVYNCGKFYKYVMIAYYAKLIESKDLFVSNSNGKIQFSKLCVKILPTELNSNRNNGAQVFEGYVGFFDLNYKFDDSIIITNESIWTQELMRKNRVFVEEEFDKSFRVYSENKELVNSIMKSNIINFILEYSQKLNIRFEIKIVNKAVFIRIFNNKLFDAPVLVSPINRKNIARCCDSLEFLKKFEENFKLTLEML